MSLTLDQITEHTFAGLVGARLEAAEEPGGPSLATLEVRESVPVGRVAEGMRRSVSVLFDGPDEAPLVQGVYWLRHQDLGELGIFLVPIARKDSALQYEAVFG